MERHHSNKQKNETIVIKIGTEALCTSDGAPDEAVLEDIVGEIATLKHAGHRVILVTSGAVGVGRTHTRDRLDLSHCDKIQEKQIAASIGQHKLMTLYEKLFERHGILVAQALTEKPHFTANGNGATSHPVWALFKRAMRQMMGRLNPNPYIVNYFHGVLPVENLIAIVNENDTAAIRELMFTDNDELTGYIAKLVNADRVIFLSSRNGVCVSGKEEDKDNVISLIDFADPSTLPQSTDGQTAGGRGGMAPKLAITKDLAGLGILVHIASSRVKGVISKIMRDESIGTKIVYGDADKLQRNWMWRFRLRDKKSTPR